MKGNEAIADILNDLITINKDRIVGYKEAIHDTKEIEEEIRRLFKKLFEQSEGFISVLKEKLKELSAEVKDKTITTGWVYNTWMDIVYADAEKPGVAHFCDEIEDMTMQAYEAALKKTENLDKNIHDLILRQKNELINSCEQIKEFRKNK